MLHKSDTDHADDDLSRRSDDILFMDLDYKKLSHYYYYNTNNYEHFLLESLEALPLASSILEKIIDEGSRILYNKYIDTKMDKFLLKTTDELINCLCDIEFQDHDDIQIGEETLTEEKEPSINCPDTWVRNKIGIEKRQNMSEILQNDLLDIPDREVSESKHSYLKSNASKMVNKSDVIKESKKIEINIVNLPEEIKTTFDPLEEQVRMKKEREMKLKEEKTQEAKQRQEEVKDQQYRLKGIQNENNKKNYTYDYEGNIIMFQPVKVDKLPPSNYVMQYVFTTFDPNQKSDDQKTKGKQKKEPKQQVSQPVNRNLLPKFPAEQGKFIPSPAIFDVFIPNPGVTLIEGVRTKAGPKIEKSALSIMNLSTMLSENNPIRLSKSEYQQLTRGGNLSRSQNYSSSTTEKEKKDKAKNFDENLLPNKKDLTMTADINLSGISDLKDLKKKNKTLNDKRDKADSIKINSNKGLYSIVERENDNLNELPKIEKPEKEPEVLKTPVDEFNLHILRSKDWGKTNVNSGFLPFLRSAIKPDEKDFKGTLGFKVKNPRDRLIKKARKEMGAHFSLGAPMIGKTFGHGIVSSSPEKLI